MTATWRAWLYEVLEKSEERVWAATAVTTLLIAVIVAGVTVTALETVEPLAETHARLLRLVEVVVLAVLTVEYALRL